MSFKMTQTGQKMEYTCVCRKVNIGKMTKIQCHLVTCITQFIGGMHFFTHITF